jgi:flavin reductase (DIM6/NTAB) family NADH-FMN oxidoreductase RutF
VVESKNKGVITLDPTEPVWEQVFMVSPLVLIGTREEGGGFDLAPKHMVMPLSWQNHLGFVCSPRHRTYQNINREKVFTASYLRPAQILEASLAAAPRCGEDDAKPSLAAISQMPAEVVDGVFVENGYLYLECELDRIVDDLGVNSLIISRIVAAHVDEDSLRRDDRDDQDLIHDSPLLAYLHPGRFAAIEVTRSFPFPAGMKK